MPWRPVQTLVRLTEPALQSTHRSAVMAAAVASWEDLAAAVADRASAHGGSSLSYLRRTYHSPELKAQLAERLTAMLALVGGADPVRELKPRGPGLQI